MRLGHVSAACGPDSGSRQGRHFDRVLIPADVGEAVARHNYGVLLSLGDGLKVASLDTSAGG